MVRHYITLTIDGAEYVAIPVEEYNALRSGAQAAQVDAIAWARMSTGESLRRAREAAGLSPAELAKRLRRSQALVSRAESGDISVSERYVASVLRACGLAQDWNPAR